MDPRLSKPHKVTATGAIPTIIPNDKKYLNLHRLQHRTVGEFSGQHCITFGHQTPLNFELGQIRKLYLHEIIPDKNSILEEFDILKKDIRSESNKPYIGLTNHESTSLTPIEKKLWFQRVSLQKFVNNK